MKIYGTYCNAYDKATAIVEEVQGESWFIEHCQNAIIIESLLIQPIQRIPRYSLLLEDLFKNTPMDHPDYENLAKSIPIIVYF